MTAPTQTPLGGVQQPHAVSGPPTFVKGGVATAPQAPATPPVGPQQDVPTFVKPGSPPPPGGFTPAPPAGPVFERPSTYDVPPAPRRFALAALALSLFTGLFLAEKVAGIGLALLSIGLVAACWTLVEEERRGPFVIATLAGAAVLGVMPAFRDSEWVTTLSLLGAITLASIAVASARTWREMFVGMFGWLAKLFPAPVVFFGQGIKRASSRRWSLAGPVARGTMLAALLVFVFGALFSAADEQFADIVRELTDWNLDVDSILLRTFLFGLVLALAGALWLTSATRRDRPAVEATTRLGRTEWTIALGATVLLFAGFVALQLPEFFGGDDLVQLTSGLTYADNARAGFVQLTLAAMLTLGVVAGAVRYGPSDDLAVRLLCGALCALTLVVLASALHRVGLYVDAFGQSRTRFSLTSLMFWLGAVLVLVVALGGLRKTAALPRVLVLVSAAFAIATVTLNPDGQVAERNVERYAATGQIDPYYLATLSADALPRLAALPDPLEACLTRRIGVRTLGATSARPYDGTVPTVDSGSDPVVGLNVARARGRDALTKLAATPSGLDLRDDCRLAN